MGCSTETSKQNSSYPLFTKDTEVLGTWWWWVDPKDEDRYLDFARGNSVNEIYYYTTEFDDCTASFIQKASNRGIKVFFLTDKYEYIWDHASFGKLMNQFTAYQTTAGEDSKFAGLHLDIEPQDHPRYSANSEAFLQDYIDFVVWVCSTYRKAPGSASGAAAIDFDIAWWFDDTVNYRGRKTELYKALIDEADRTFVMSYKNTAEKTYEISKEEIAYAKSVDKPIILGAETGRIRKEKDVSFYGMGRTYFYDQLHKLHSLVDYPRYGLAIHYISAWYAMTP